MFIFLQICAIMTLILVFPTTYTLHTLETPIREAFLKPRNFNPHPYKQPSYHLHDETSINLNGITTNYIDQAVHNAKTSELFPARQPSNGIRRCSDLENKDRYNELNINKSNNSDITMYLTQSSTTSVPSNFDTRCGFTQLTFYGTICEKKHSATK